jgi:hypothetical protein
MPYLNKRDNFALKTATILSTLALFAGVTSIVTLSAPPFWLSAEAATGDEEVEESNEQSASIGTVIPSSTDFDNIPDIISNITDIENITGSVPSSTDFDNIPDIILNSTDDISSRIPTVTDLPGQEQAGVDNEQDEEEVLETDNLEDLAKYA